MIVVDSSVLAARNLTSALTPLAIQLEKSDPVWIAPFLWRYEFQNILVKCLWARLFAPEAAARVWQVVLTQMADNEYEPSAERVIELAARHRVTAYDATFIALAMEAGAPCVTEDGELLEKFPDIAVSIQAFLDRNRDAGAVREARASYRARLRGRKAEM